MCLAGAGCLYSGNAHPLSQKTQFVQADLAGSVTAPEALRNCSRLVDANLAQPSVLGVATGIESVGMAKL
jgi:hypothetical protein